MAECYETESLAAVYHLLCSDVLQEGSLVSPRGQTTEELLDVTIQVNDPTNVGLHAVNRVGYKPAIGIAEGLLLVAGVSDPALMTRISRVFAGFTDGGAFHGAYGPRVRMQLPRVIERLADDPDTRQAVVTIWDPLHDGAGPDQEPPRDLPCTVYLNFRVRDGKLSLKTHMRSNDLWLGLPYDFIQFTLLQCTVASVLGLEPGPYVHHVDSLHLYEQHWEAANETYAPQGTWSRLGGISAATWSQARLLALELLYENVVWTEGSNEHRMDAVLGRYRP